jgi:hypothetical protein
MTALHVSRPAAAAGVMEDDLADIAQVHVVDFS